VSLPTYQIIRPAPRKGASRIEIDDIKSGRRDRAAFVWSDGLYEWNGERWVWVDTTRTRS